MCQCRSISHDKCTTLVGNVDRGGGYAFAGQGVYGKSLYRQLYFAVNLTLLWKIKSILRKYLIWLPQRICPLGFLLYLWCVQLNTDKWRCSMEKKSPGTNVIHVLWLQKGHGWPPPSCTCLTLNTRESIWGVSTASFGQMFYEREDKAGCLECLDLGHGFTPDYKYHNG